MISSIIHRVASEEALDYWQQRLAGEGIGAERNDGPLVFSDPEGMRHELGRFERPDEPLIARSSETPEEFALQGFEGVRALVGDPGRSEVLLREALGFSERSEHDLGGPRRAALPPNYEPIRSRVEPILTPLPDIRQWCPAPARTDSQP